MCELVGRETDLAWRSMVQFDGIRYIRIHIFNHIHISTMTLQSMLTLCESSPLLLPTIWSPLNGLTDCEPTVTSAVQEERPYARER
jgi:hypothetical protein